MKRKKKKVDRYAKVVAQYEDPTVAGSLGGVTRFAKAHKLSAAKVRAKLESSLGYTLHKPTRHHFRTLPVLVYAMDDQWWRISSKWVTSPKPIAVTVTF